MYLFLPKQRSISIEEVSLREKSRSRIQFVDVFFVEMQSKVYGNHTGKILQISLLCEKGVPPH